MKLNDYNIISGNSKVVRIVNRAVVLNVIREMQPISRARIAKLTGLNKSTVSSIVSDLLEEELIFEQPNKAQNVGRNPIDLHLQLGKHFVGAVNIDVAVSHLAVADIDGSFISTSSITTDSKNPEQFLEQCIQELFSLRDRSNIQRFKGVGVSITGIVDPESLVVKFAPNLGWMDFDIGKVLKKLCVEEAIIAVGNDAKSSALAELWFGQHKINLSNFVFLSIGPGIGTGIVVENTLVNGEFQASGEFGHMTIFEGGELCSCGNYGCWEAYASDRATVRRYITRKEDEADSSVSITLKEIIDLAKDEKDHDAIETLKQTGYYLGVGIANIIKTIDPQAIIVGGRIVEAWGILYPEILQTVKKRTFFRKERDIHVLPTSLAVSPRLLGAATLAIKEIFTDFRITR